jgi:hypothetical protein
MDAVFAGAADHCFRRNKAEWKGIETGILQKCEMEQFQGSNRKPWNDFVLIPNF